MPAPLKTTLTPEESATLSELRVASSVNHRVRDRAHMVLLNADGWSVASIADIFKCHEHTVRAALKRWQKAGLYGLWEKGGRGQKPTWQPSDLDYLVACLEEEERTYNSRQLAAKLAVERQVRLSPDRIRKLLKKRTIDGNAPGTVTGSAKTPSLELPQQRNSSAWFKKGQFRVTLAAQSRPSSAMIHLTDFVNTYALWKRLNPSSSSQWGCASFVSNCFGLLPTRSGTCDLMKQR